MTAFPGATATFPGFTAGHTLAADTHAAQHNLEQAEIVATQTKVGTGASTPTANTVLRSNVNGTSVWGAVTLTTDVTGILPVGNGGTGTTATTGTGSVVFGTSPTISGAILTGQPTITDHTNATHGHTSSATGGVLSLVGSIVVQKFLSSGTYTPNPKMIYCIIECVGGGGGGGGVVASSTYNLYSSGGGSGAYSRLYATASTIGSSQVVTIGTAGSGATAGANNGGNGGTTSVGSICTAGGGGGATYVQAGVIVSSPGSGGTAGTGDLSTTGSAGYTGFYSGVVGQDLQMASGNGGNSVFGGNGIGTVNADGNNATPNSGSGGAGGAQYHGSNVNRAGGNGGTGIVVITEFCTL